MLHCTSPLSLDLISSILFSSHAIYGSIIYFAYIIILQVCFLYFYVFLLYCDKVCFKCHFCCCNNIYVETQCVMNGFYNGNCKAFQEGSEIRTFNYLSCFDQ